MEVILLQKVANLGNIGDRVKVKSGFGRNFLLPQGKATLATPGERREVRRAPRGAREGRARAAHVRRRALGGAEGFQARHHARRPAPKASSSAPIGTADIAEALNARELQGRAQRSAPAERPAAHGRRARRESASACGRRCAAAGDDRRRRIASAAPRFTRAPSGRYRQSPS